MKQKLEANVNGTSTEKNPQNLFQNYKKAVLFKAKFEQLFIMTKKEMKKQKSIIIFILFSIICIKKHYHFLAII